MREVVERERDPRSTNRMDPETRVIHGRLEAWARWSRDAEARGFSAGTAISRMMEMGINGAGAPTPPVEMPEAIAEIDEAVSALPAAEMKVIRRYYLRWEPTEVSAAALRISVRELQRLLWMARHRIGWTMTLKGKI